MRNPRYVTPQSGFAELSLSNVASGTAVLRVGAAAQTTQSRTLRMNAVKEGPTFYPTEEEWNEASPLDYLEKIRDRAEAFGICKIVPPASWKPPFCAGKVEPDAKFATRVQVVGDLEGASRFSRAFDLAVRRFNFARGEPMGGSDELQAFKKSSSATMRTPTLLELFRAAAGGSSDDPASVREEGDLRRINFESVAQRLELDPTEASALETAFKRFLYDFAASALRERRRAVATSSETAATSTKTVDSESKDPSPTGVAQRMSDGPTDDDDVEAACDCARETALQAQRAARATHATMALIEAVTKSAARHVAPRAASEADGDEEAPRKRSRGRPAAKGTTNGPNRKRKNTLDMRLRGKSGGGRSEAEASRVRTPRPGLKYWRCFKEANHQTCPMTVRERVYDEESGEPTERWAVDVTRLNEVSKELEYFEFEYETSQIERHATSGTNPDEAYHAVVRGICEECYRAAGGERGGMLACRSCRSQWHGSCVEPRVAIPWSAAHDDEYERHYHQNLKRDWFCEFCRTEAGYATESSELRTKVKDLEASLKAGLVPTHEVEDRKRDVALWRALEAQRSHISLTARCADPKRLADFGFGEGDDYTLEEYTAMAERFEQAVLKPFLGEAGFEQDDLRAELFWDLASGRVDWSGVARATRAMSAELDPDPSTMTVSYGNDVDTDAGVGSGFVTQRYVDAKRERGEIVSANELKYLKHDWNLNNLPTADGSLLQFVGANISGIVVPWLYMGMAMSAFCWHAEDHFFASINYNHKGRAKAWWGVSGKDAATFEAAARSIAPELFECRPSLLLGIVTMFRPDQLAQMGVDVCRILQRPGEYVVTFPRAYHGGANLGLNCAEAVNFATRRWLPFGQPCVDYYAHVRKSPVVAHESLVVVLAREVIKKYERASGSLSSQDALLARDLLVELKNVVATEKAKRCAWTRSRGASSLAVRAAPLVVNEDTSSSPASSSPIKGASPAKKIDVALVGADAAAAESPHRRNAVHREGRERVVNLDVMMARTGGLAAIFNGAKRCTSCRRYVALTFVTRADGGKSGEGAEAACFEHAEDLRGTGALVATATLEDSAMESLVGALEAVARATAKAQSSFE